ncbi:MAG: hypothetical protein H0T42_05575 [Deltaproteobacteria bacterium]|nr:hypothetical protein [Deltaproteobacteria bacterium]
MKLAFFAVVLGLGTGACVADEPTSGRVGGQVTDFTVADEAEIPKDEGVVPDFAVVTITGMEIPGRTPTTESIDITSVDTAWADPQIREICAQADQLPDSDVCSLICQPTGIAAKLYDQGAVGGCSQHTCAMPGDVTVSFDICVGD